MTRDEWVAAFAAVAAVTAPRSTELERADRAEYVMTPFRIEIPEADLNDLRYRLRRTRWPDPEPVDDWSQGIPLAYVQEALRLLGRPVRLAATEASSTSFRNSGPRSTDWACTSSTSAHPIPIPSP